MREYVIIAGVTCDLPLSIVKEMNIEILPMSFSIGGQEYIHYLDEREISLDDVWQKIKAGEETVTALITPADFIDAFTPYLDQGKDVIYIGFSSGLSGTFNASLIAKNELQEKYPEAKIHCVDSLGACSGEGMLIYYAAKKRAEGMDIDTLAKWVEDNRLHLCHWFTIDDLQHVRRSGRLSALSAFMGSLLNIKPVMHVDDNGLLIPVEKVRSHKKALAAIANKMVELADKPQEQEIFICHCGDPEGADKIAEIVRSHWDIKNIYITRMGPIIGSHVGIGTVSLFFWSKKDVKR